MKKILITTAIDYTNDIVHLGHSYQKIVADALARYYRISGDSTYFVTGTDEHGGNIEASAKDHQKSPKQHVDIIADEDKKQWQALDISYDRFIRTTDEDHEKIVIEFWKKCQQHGDIYKGKFKGLYCYGCESFKTESEITDGRCSLHSTKQLAEVEEENYFFAWSKYQKFLEDWFLNHKDFVYPTSRYNEMFEFLKKGLADITISRSVDKIKWGFEVPDDNSQVIYVWFDALINYFTVGNSVGFWDPDTKIIHILGKDNTRWHSLLWPAMLQSAGYRLPNTIYAHGFINLDGKKISKSLGNIIRPTDLVDQFGSDAVRYYLLKYGPAIDDVDLSLDKLKKVYNSELANDWGNLVQRTSVLCTKVTSNKKQETNKNQFSIKVKNPFEALQIAQGIEEVSRKIGELNLFINQNEPWKKSGEELEKILSHVVSGIIQCAYDLQPVMPASSKQIIKQFTADKIVPNEPLFLRKK